MANIDIISTCLVRMATSSLNNNNGAMSRVYLTPWDVKFLLLDPIQKGLLFLKPESETQKQEFEKTFIHHLKTSLSRTLDFFPPLAGRFGKTENEEDNTSRFFVDCNNAGALFTHSIVRNLYVRDILDHVHIPSLVVQSFFSLNRHLNIEGLNKPLLGVQVTELVDGFFVALTINHCLIDGTSFWHFFNSWSEISRGMEKISKFPIFERSFFTNYLDGSKESTFVSVPNMDLNLDNSKFQQPQVLERVFHFSKESISKLKNRANMEIGTFENKISSLQALLAHLWRGVMRCRGVGPGEEAICSLLIGTRNRIPLPETYFGNAVYFAKVVTENKYLMENGLGWVGSELNKTVAKQTREEVIKAMEESAKNLKLMNKGELQLLKNSLLIGSSPRFNVYGTDFGWGKPVAVRSGAGQKCDGKMTLFPAAEDGGIDVEACLMPESMYALGNDAEFMEAVTA